MTEFQSSTNFQYGVMNVWILMRPTIATLLYPVLRSLLIECDYNPSVDLLSSEHNECNAPLILAPFSQSASLKHTASSIDELPSHLQQFLLQHNISLISRTPLHAFTLMDELATHPNQNFVHELIHNIQHGCSIGYNGPQF